MKMGQEYHCADARVGSFYATGIWQNDSLDQLWAKRGSIHLTPEAAALHGKALASLTAGEGVEP
jgi:hypothetical protein